MKDDPRRERAEQLVMRVALARLRPPRAATTPLVCRHDSEARRACSTLRARGARRATAERGGHGWTRLALRPAQLRFVSRRDRSSKRAVARRPKLGGQSTRTGGHRSSPAQLPLATWLVAHWSSGVVCAAASVQARTWRCVSGGWLSGGVSCIVLISESAGETSEQLAPGVGRRCPCLAGLRSPSARLGGGASGR